MSTIYLEFLHGDARNCMKVGGERRFRSSPLASNHLSSLLKQIESTIVRGWCSRRREIWTVVWSVQMVSGICIIVHVRSFPNMRKLIVNGRVQTREVIWLPHISWWYPEEFTNRNLFRKTIITKSKANFLRGSSSRQTSTRIGVGVSRTSCSVTPAWIFNFFVLFDIKEAVHFCKSFTKIKNICQLLAIC